MSTPASYIRTAPFEGSPRGHIGSPSHSRPATTVRVLLGARKAELTARLALRAATLHALGSSSSEDASSLFRAMVALRMYRVREEIEEIDDALLRLEHGSYGICDSCGGPISFEHLNTVPQARLCAECPSAAPPSMDGLAGPRLGPGRGEHAAAVRPPTPVCSPPHPDLDRSNSVVSEGTSGDAAAR
jgi:RNA polymerase-binding transcription factor DksA